MKSYLERGGCMREGWGAQGRQEKRRERRGMVGLNEKWVHSTARSMSEAGEKKNGFYPSFPFFI